MSITFSLEPFKQEDLFHEFRITGKIKRGESRLQIYYELSGPFKELVISPPSERPERMDRLWESTCFELFLKIKDTKGYWEFNLSPSGHWNVFRFTSYRRGMQEEGSYNSLPFSVSTGHNLLTLNIEINMKNLIPLEQAVNAGICAVTEDRKGRMAYWALAHPGMKPDFHMPGSFIIEL